MNDDDVIYGTGIAIMALILLAYYFFGVGA
jgi:hypothetical protein